MTTTTDTPIDKRRGRVTVYSDVDPEVRDQLDDVATQRGMSRAQFVRYLISRELGVPLTPSYRKVNR